MTELLLFKHSIILLVQLNVFEIKMKSDQTLVYTVSIHYVDPT